MLLANGQLHLDQAGGRKRLHARQSLAEIGVVAVKAVDDHEAWQIELIQVTPGNFGANFQPGNRIHQHQRSIGNREGRNDLADEIRVTGGIQHIDFMIAVFDRQHTCINRNLTPNLFFVVIRNARPVLHLTQARRSARKMQKCLCQHGFAGPAMRHQRHIAEELSGILFHDNLSCEWDNESTAKGKKSNRRDIE